MEGVEAAWLKGRHFAEGSKRYVVREVIRAASPWPVRQNGGRAATAMLGRRIDVGVIKLVALQNCWEATWRR